MKKIKDLYKYSKDNTLKLLFNNVSGITYPTIEGNTSNFLTDYAAMAAEIDKMFYIRYSAMKTIIPEDEETQMSDYYNDWQSFIKGILSFYLDSWARLYYALSLPYNPIYNVDGTTSRRTTGKTEGLSGSDTTTMTRAQQEHTDTYGEDSTETIYGQDTTNISYGGHGASDTHSEVPFDSGIEKEVSADSHTEDPYNDTTIRSTRTDNETRYSHIDSHVDGAHTDTDQTAYGRQNNVDYTETETRQGNIGVTMTQTMLSEEFKLRTMSFWDNVFKAIVKEMLYF